VIPKPLDQIEWADLELLKDSEREESDTIEFKGSFSGGSDYLSFSESQRERAIRGIARETIAFLNGRGGDTVIGAEEEENENPKIKSLKPFPNATAIADRLAQSLSAVIEPYQSVVGVRAIRNGPDDVGVIVVRAPQSLRAPHRLTRDKECYIRRGRESVPMPMDEIQDVTLMRAARRSEILRVLEEMFSDLTLDRVRGVQLPNERFRLKAVYLPLVHGEIDLSQETLSRLRHSKPTLSCNENPCEYVSVLDCVDHTGKPVLRGRMYEGSQDRGARQVHCATAIYTRMMVEWDYVDSGRYHDKRAEAEVGMFDGWILGFLAGIIFSLSRILDLHGAYSQGILRFELFVKGEQNIIVGSNLWREKFSLSEGRIQIPDFEVTQASDLADIFIRLQHDFYSIAGVEGQGVFAISELK
jgi:Putative DNA-binding domain